MKCYHCGSDNVSNKKYCSSCGKPIIAEKIDIEDKNRIYFVQTIILFVFIILVIVFSHEKELGFLQHNFIFHGLLIVATIIFGILNFRDLVKTFRFSFHPKVMMYIFIGAPVLAYFLIGLKALTISIFDLDYFPLSEGYKIFTSNMYAYGLLSVSVLPGIFEELLFRGILFNLLLKLTTPKNTIIITGFLFAFFHFAFLSLIWLVPFGIFMGYLRFRYRSVVYGILLHIVLNASSFLIEIVLS